MTRTDRIKVALDNVITEIYDRLDDNVVEISDANPALHGTVTIMMGSSITQLDPTYIEVGQYDNSREEDHESRLINDALSIIQGRAQVIDRIAGLAYLHYYLEDVTIIKTIDDDCPQGKYDPGFYCGMLKVDNCFDANNDLKDQFEVSEWIA